MGKFLRKEVITPAVTLLFLVIYIIEAMKLSAPIVKGVPQESFFPIIIVIVGVLTAGSLLYSGIKTALKENVTTDMKPKSYKPLLVVAALAFLVAFFDTLGYVIVAPIFVFALMMIFDDKPQHIVKKIIFSVLVAAFVYVLYTYAFDIQFPEIWR